MIGWALITFALVGWVVRAHEKESNVRLAKMFLLGWIVFSFGLWYIGPDPTGRG